MQGYCKPTWQEDKRSYQIYMTRRSLLSRQSISSYNHVSYAGLDRSLKASVTQATATVSTNASARSLCFFRAQQSSCLSGVYETHDIKHSHSGILGEASGVRDGSSSGG